MLQFPNAQRRSQEASRARNSFVDDCFIGGRFLSNVLMRVALVDVVLVRAILTGTAPTRLR